MKVNLKITAAILSSAVLLGLALPINADIQDNGPDDCPPGEEYNPEIGLCE